MSDGIIHEKITSIWPVTSAWWHNPRIVLDNFLMPLNPTRVHSSHVLAFMCSGSSSTGRITAAAVVEWRR
uniref:Uncharacterized protein n=1 Tax=Oryza glaberrima TaxID=4538 RepID=I1R8V3_ORYGL